MRRPRRYTHAVLALLLASTAAVADSAPRRLIGPGDLVPGFGRVGGWGFSGHGLDDAGRLLIQRDDTSTPPLWADEHGLVAAVDAPAPFPLRLEEHIDVHPSGAFTFLGRPREGGPDGVYAVVDRQLRRVAAAGDRDAAGATLCRLSAPRINAAGAVVFGALITPPGTPCDPPDEGVDAGWRLVSATYLASAGDLQRLPRSGGVLALGEDGSVVFDDGAVVEADGTTTALPELRGPSGAVIAVQRLFAANRRGALVFWGREAGQASLYRGDARGVVALVTAGEPAPWGGVYEHGHVQYPFRLSIDDAGDVLIAFNELRVGFYPASGAARHIPGYALGGAWLNDRGQLALLTLAGLPGRLEAVRWQGEQATRLVGSGDPLPDGGYLLNQGLESRCVGADGSVAVVGDAVPDGHGLLCVDAAGAHAVVRRGDGTPVGRRFYEFGPCAIPRPGEIVFSADRLLPYDEPGSSYSYYTVEPALYRATDGALERVIGPDDVTEDRDRVAAVRRLSSYQASFATNRRGDLLALVQLGDLRRGEIALVLREAGGALRRLPLSLGEAGGWGGIGFPPDSPLDHEYLAGLRDEPLPTRTPVGAAVGRRPLPRAGMASPSAAGGYAVQDALLLDSGEAVLLATEGSDAWSANRLLFVAPDGIAATLRTDDPVFAGEVEWFEVVRALGDWIVLQAGGYRSRAVYAWRRGTMQPLRLFGSADGGAEAPSRSFSLRGVDADGRIYFDDYVGNRAAYRYWEDGTFHTVADFALNLNWLTDVAPTGALLLQDDSTAVQMLGDGPSAASCPLPPTLVLPTLTITATPTATPTVTATRSATPTRSASPTRSTTPVPRCDVDAAVCLRVAATGGVAGGIATVAVRLEAPGVAVAATQNDLRLPDGLHWRGCEVDAAIDRPNSAFRVDGDRLRALVLSFGHVSAISDGATLYRCRIAIDAQVAAGRYPIACADPGASTPDGGALATACRGAEIDIAAAPTPSPAVAPSASRGPGDAALREAGGGGMGCAVAPGDGAGSATWLGLVALLAWRRRAGRR